MEMTVENWAPRREAGRNQGAWTSEPADARTGKEDGPGRGLPALQAVVVASPGRLKIQSPSSRPEVLIL